MMENTIKNTVKAPSKLKCKLVGLLAQGVVLFIFALTLLIASVIKNVANAEEVSTDSQREPLVTLTQFCEMGNKDAYSVIKNNIRIDGKISVTANQYESLTTRERRLVDTDGQIYEYACSTHILTFINEIRLGNLREYYDIKPLTENEALELAHSRVHVDERTKEILRDRFKALDVSDGIINRLDLALVLGASLRGECNALLTITPNHDTRETKIGGHTRLRAAGCRATDA